MTELKPCPCCGPKAFIIPTTKCDPPIGEHCWTAKLRCHECGLNISRTAATEKEALDQVIEAWNTRVERTCKPKSLWTNKSRSRSNDGSESVNAGLSLGRAQTNMLFHFASRIIALAAAQRWWSE